MTKVMLTCGDYQFFARLEEEKAPRTCAIFKKMLPIEDRLIHVRWSGEGMWIPMGDTRWEGLDFENHTSYPSKGELLIYPGGISEMEMILAYGGGSGFSGTQETIAKLEPSAAMLKDKRISRSSIEDTQPEIINWLQSIGMLNANP